MRDQYLTCGRKPKGRGFLQGENNNHNNNIRTQKPPSLGAARPLPTVDFLNDSIITAERRNSYIDKFLRVCVSVIYVEDEEIDEIRFHLLPFEGEEIFPSLFR